MKFNKNNLYLIKVDVSASTEAFFGTICLIAVRRSVSRRTGCRRWVGFNIVYRVLFEHRDSFRILLRHLRSCTWPTSHQVRATSFDYISLRRFAIRIAWVQSGITRITCWTLFIARLF